jgi:peptidoglycan/LPS O-acetylase OafA/YrhL
VHSSCFGLSPDQWAPFQFTQAVSFFFVLSGFILCHAYPQLQSWEQRGRFLLARFARLWPAHVAAFLLTEMLFADAVSPMPGVSRSVLAALNLAMMHSWVPVYSVYCSWNGVSWSIATEFGFYLCFLFLIGDWARSWRWKLPLTLGLPIGLIGLCAMAGLPRWPGLHDTSPNGWLYIHPLARLFEFTLGMSASLLWRRIEPRLTVGRAAGTLAEAAALGLVVVNMYYAEALAKAALALPVVGLYAQMWLTSAGSCLSFGVLIGVFACERGWLSRALAVQPLQLLGEISFGVYMLHPILLRFYVGNIGLFEHVPFWRRLTGFWVVLLVGSHFLWAAVERPVRQWLIGLWPRKEQRGAAAPRSSFWERLTSPSGAWLTGEALVVLLLLLPAARFALTSPRPGATVYVPVVAPSPPSVVGAQFDDRFQVQMAYVDYSKGRTPLLRLAWRSIGEQRRDLLVAVHLLDAEDHVIGYAEEPLDRSQSKASDGELWLESLELPPDALKQARHLGVGLYQDPTHQLHVVKGPSDRWKGRLLLPVER